MAPPRALSGRSTNSSNRAIAGDIFDFGWKANDRNFTLLMMHRGDLPKRTTLGYWLRIVVLLLLGLVCIVAPVAFVVWLIWCSGYLQG